MTALLTAETPLYTREPLDEIDGIPTFCRRDAYVKNYDAIAHDHLKHIALGGLNPWQESATILVMESATANFVRQHVGSGSRVLDIGVCVGRTLKLLPDYDCYGVDISRQYLKVVAQQGVKVALARAEDLPYPDGYFDAVIVSDILEHVIDLHATVSEALRVLRPGGHLVVRVPCETDLSPYLAGPYKLIHLRKFDSVTLHLLLNRVHDCTILLEADITIGGAHEILQLVQKP